MSAAVCDEKKQSNDNELTANETKKVNAMSRSAFLMAVSIALCVPARAPLVLAIKKGDTAATAKTMGLMSTCAAAVEFLINPTLGRLSDEYGRKPFLFMAAATNAFLHALVAVFPKSLPINIVDRAISGAMIFAFFNPIGAASQDIFAHQSLEKLGVVGAKFGAMFGFGFALGPLLGAKLGGEKAFAGSALAYAATAVSIALTFEETLTEDKKKEFDIKACNPFSFFKLFSNAKMTKLMASLGFNSFAEYANIYDINFLYLKTAMGYGQNEVGLFATGYGCTQIFGSLLGKVTLPKFGHEACTTFSNLAYIVGFGLMGSARGLTQLILTLAFLMMGHGRSGLPALLLAEEATKLGMGRGEIGGAQGNFLAILKIVAPLMYGRLFAWGTSKGRNIPGLPYFTVCLFVAAAQASFTKALADKKSQS